MNETAPSPFTSRHFEQGSTVAVYLGRGRVRRATVLEHDTINRRVRVHYEIDQQHKIPDRQDEWVSENQL